MSRQRTNRLQGPPRRPWTTLASILQNFGGQGTCALVRVSRINKLTVGHTHIQIVRTAGNFWDTITTTKQIDLTEFDLPGSTTSVEFSFMDPLYVWITRCDALIEAGQTVHWESSTLRHPATGEVVHGAGIQYSALLRAAIQQASGRVALINLNWDGGLLGFGSRSCTPIHVQVMNTNSSSTIAVGLVGYLPFIEVPEGFRASKQYKAAHHHLLQTCIGHILASIEARALDGFRCCIAGESMLLFPRIGVMSLDTPERKKYFGLRNQSSCGICRKRKGRSLTRQATCHRPREVQNLFRVARGPAVGRRQQRTRKRARDRLLRHGFKYKMKCRLTEYATRSLIHIPSIGPRLFGGLCRYERMHTYFIGFCSYLLELLVECVTEPAGYKQVQETIRQCHQFRDPLTGTTHPRLPNLLKMTHLTAERRVRAIFYWAHALGLKAEVLQPPDIRIVSQRAVMTLQIILIAVRGHRAYTSAELDFIFKGVGRQFFIALEELSRFLGRKKIDRQARLHERNPNKFRAPVPFRRAKRFFCLSMSISRHICCFLCLSMSSGRFLYVRFCRPLCRHFKFSMLGFRPLCQYISTSMSKP